MMKLPYIKAYTLLKEWAYLQELKLENNIQESPEIEEVIHEATLDIYAEFQETHQYLPKMVCLSDYYDNAHFLQWIIKKHNKEEEEQKCED